MGADARYPDVRTSITTDHGIRRALVVLLAAVLVVAGTAAWTLLTPTEQLREALRVSLFWVLEALFLVLAVATLLAVWRFRLYLLVRDSLLMAALAGAALGLVSLAPQTNRIFYDEHIYQGVAQNLAELRFAQMCNDGTAEYGILQCWRHEYNKQPYGYPYVLSFLYRVFGVTDVLAHRLNAALAAATVVVIYLIVLFATADRFAAAMAGAALLAMPENLRWSHSAASEPSAAFFCGLAMLAVIVWRRERSALTLLWVAAASAFAAHIRPESILIVPVAAISMVDSRFRALIYGRSRWILVLWVAMLMPEVAHMAAVRGESWGASGERMSLVHAAVNVRTNAAFYIADWRFPALVTLLTVIGLARRRETFSFVVWFSAFWLVYLLFYAGSYDYGADVRYSLLTYPALACLAGVGAARVTRWITLRVPSQIARGIVPAALGVSFLWYLPWVRATGEEAWAARADVRFARELVPTLPQNAVVLTHNPGMFHLWGQSAAQLSLATTEPAYVRDTLAARYAGGVYVYWNFWCNVKDDTQTAFCRHVLASFPNHLVHEYRERNYRYALYRLELLQ